MVRRLLSATLVALALNLAASEVKIETVNGDIIQGEYLGSEDNAVKLRSPYGLVKIPSQQIAKLVTVKGALPLDENAVAPEEKFPVVKMPDFAALEMARCPEPAEPSKLQRQELHRAVRNFAGSAKKSRNKIIGLLQSYGMMSYPFVEAAYVEPEEIFDRVQLLSALAQAGRPYTAHIFSEAHRAALKLMDQIAAAPPITPPDYLSKKEREAPNGKAENVKAAALNVLTIEGYAATAGGPFNALFLLGLYKDRYDSPESNPLLLDLDRDRARLAAAGGDATRSRSSWTTGDRVLLGDVVLPMYFQPNDDLKNLVLDLLKQVLPSDHPAWNAPKGDWVQWWKDARAELLKD